MRASGAVWASVVMVTAALPILYVAQTGNPIVVKRTVTIHDTITSTLKDTVPFVPPPTVTDARDTVLYIACDNGTKRKISYHRPIEWERVHENGPSRININVIGDDNITIASILGRNCSVARIPLY